MRWTLLPKPDPDKTAALANELSIDPVLSGLLVQRGIESFDQAKTFFRPSLEQLHDPFLMQDMQAAVDRIRLAMQEGQHILVYGDYDVDGTTSVAMMSTFLKESYPHVSTYIPDRYTEGYGVSTQGIDYAADNEVSLIIALDCGVKAIDKVAYAKEQGIDFIICDHHRPGPELPDAVAVLDPKREDCSYPYKELCGCGVGFKLMQALTYTDGGTLEELLPYLDLVVTAIGADIVPMTGENRVLAHYGLQVINKKPRIGIAALKKARVKPEYSIGDVVFTLAPRINAAGRMQHGNQAVALLSATDPDLARQLAMEIEANNTERRSTDEQISKEALQQLEDNNEQDRFTTVVYDPSWHKGVIGIVASRLTETYYRPTLVFTKSGDKLAASARSVRGFDVYEALGQCAEHLEQFGGHKYAAGLTMKPEQYEGFKAAFEAVVRDTIDPNLLTPEIKIDTSLDFRSIQPKFYRILKQFAPFGPGNMAPVFMTEGVRDTGYAKAVGGDGTHLKAAFSQHGVLEFGAIGFRMAGKLDALKNGSVKIAYNLDENEWQGRVSLQLKLKDIKA